LARVVDLVRLRLLLGQRRRHGARSPALYDSPTTSTPSRVNPVLTLQRVPLDALNVARDLTARRTVNRCSQAYTDLPVALSATG
jgi:hypothetical protein